MILKVFIYICGSAMVLFILLVLFLFSVVNPTDVSKNSLAYRFGFPNELKTIPIFAECQPATYSSEGRDGERVGSVDIKYKSYDSADDLDLKYKSYFESIECKADDNTHYKCPWDSFTVYIDRGNPCTSVHIIGIGDFE